MGTEAIQSKKRSRPFWQRYLIILAVDSLIVFLVSAVILLFGGNNQISNLYFLSTGVLLVIAVIPIFSEMGGNLKLAGKVLKGDEAEKLVLAQAERSRQGVRTTYLYGLAGITTFVLAMVFI